MPEAIPAPAAIIYNAIPARILREPETELAKEVASKIGRGTILDIGSGTGFLATEIAKKSQSVEVTESSEFMKNYQMELTGVWMKIIFTKCK